MKATLYGLGFVAVLAIALFFSWNFYFSFFGNSVTVGSLVMLIGIPFLLGILIGFFMGRKTNKPKT